MVVGDPGGPTCNTFLICSFDCCNLLYIAVLPGTCEKKMQTNNKQAHKTHNPASKKVTACFLSKTGRKEPVSSILLCLCGLLGGRHLSYVSALILEDTSKKSPLQP